MGIGDWGLGIGDWAQSPIPNPPSPIPNPQSPIPNIKNFNNFKLLDFILLINSILFYKYFYYLNININGKRKWAFEFI